MFLLHSPPPAGRQRKDLFNPPSSRIGGPPRRRRRFLFNPPSSRIGGPPRRRRRFLFDQTSSPRRRGPSQKELRLQRTISGHLHIARIKAQLDVALVAGNHILGKAHTH